MLPQPLVFAMIMLSTNVTSNTGTKKVQLLDDRTDHPQVNYVEKFARTIIILYHWISVTVSEHLFALMHGQWNIGCKILGYTRKLTSCCAVTTDNSNSSRKERDILQSCHNFPGTHDTACTRKRNRLPVVGGSGLSKYTTCQWRGRNFKFTVNLQCDMRLYNLNVVLIDTRLNFRVCTPVCWLSTATTTEGL